jgi:Ca-activated chloride channel family protein
MERFGYVLAGRAPSRWLPAAIAALLALALSGPALRRAEAPTFRNLDGVSILIDLSRSISQGEALPGSLAAGRLVAQASAARPVALIVYAGDAYLASPFTTDAEALGTMIGALDGETVPDPGSCLDCALLLARTMLDQAKMAASDVVLISDGGGAGEAQGGVDALRAAGARLSTLFVAPSAAPGGMPPPDPAALDALAARGGGRAGDAVRPGEVLEMLSAPGGAAEGTGDVRLLTHLDLGRCLLLPAALLALGLFRRSA